MATILKVLKSNRVKNRMENKKGKQNFANEFDEDGKNLSKLDI